jgi:hypothetical protein
MDKFKFAPFTPLYRAEMASLENFQSFYERVDGEVERLLQRTPQNRPTLPDADATSAQAQAHWAQYAEETRFQIIQSSR